uniref:tRNA-intron lyase n=1 Tax=Anopheles culicifacies TaxID=139723 RepID=A0A182MSK9_9DIPT
MLSRAFPACVTHSREQLVRKRKQKTATTAPIAPSTSQEDVNEPLCLFLEEAFFLMHTLGILHVKDLYDKQIDIREAFERFRKIKKNFVACYCAYLYLKSKNWIIKSGIKFGGDFVIYVRGPQFYHASYIVLVQEMLAEKQIDLHTVDGLDFQGFNRIAETTAKDVLFLEVHYPSTLDLSDSAACLERLKEFSGKPPTRRLRRKKRQRHRQHDHQHPQPQTASLYANGSIVTNGDCCYQPSRMRLNCGWRVRKGCSEHKAERGKGKAFAGSAARHNSAGANGGEPDR